MSLRHGILGFLELEASTGYTLRQRFQGSVGSFWSATQSQIYRELHALEHDELVRVEVVPQEGKPARKIYSLTPRGREALRRWLAEPVGPTQLRDPLQLKLVFAAEVDPTALDDVLAHYAEQITATHEEYRARRGMKQIFDLARSPRERTLWELSIDNGIMWCEMQLAWTAEARRRLAFGNARKKGKKR